MLAAIVTIVTASFVRAADAPYVTPWTNGGAVTTANPLPVVNI